MSDVDHDGTAGELDGFGDFLVQPDIAARSMTLALRR